jgi:hypothetical protein
MSNNHPLDQSQKYEGGHFQCWLHAQKREAMPKSPCHLLMMHHLPRLEYFQIVELVA